MNLKSSTKLYNDWHKFRNDTDKIFHVLNDPWHQTVIKILPDLSNKKILEIGCGRGDFAIWLAYKFPTSQIFATDFSDVAISSAKNKISSEITNLFLEVQNAEMLDYEDEAFDFVISSETLEHVSHPQLMINEISRVLKKEGLFILTTENYFNAMSFAWIKSWITGQPFNSGSGIQPIENYFLFFLVYKYFTKSKLLITSTYSNGYQWLLFPNVSPDKLSTKEFKFKFLRKIFKPFGRHYTYVGRKL